MNAVHRLALPRLTSDNETPEYLTYRWHCAPDDLLTARQLRARGLRPGGQDPAAEIRWRRGRRVAYLYRVDLAKPKRTATASQRVAIAKALTARRTCPTCDVVRDYYIPRRYGECFECAPEARKWVAA